MIGRAISHSTSTRTSTASRPPAITARVVLRSCSCAYCSETDTATVQSAVGHRLHQADAARAGGRVEVGDVGTAALAHGIEQRLQQRPSTWLYAVVQAHLQFQRRRRMHHVQVLRAQHTAAPASRAAAGRSACAGG